MSAPPGLISRGADLLLGDLQRLRVMRQVTAEGTYNGYWFPAASVTAAGALDLERRGIGYDDATMRELAAAGLATITGPTAKPTRSA